MSYLYGCRGAQARQREDEPMQHYSIIWSVADHGKALQALKRRGMRPGEMRVDIAAQLVTIQGSSDRRPALPPLFTVREG